jgi:hypothetical protein
LNEAGTTRRAVLWNGSLKRLYVQKHKAKEHCVDLLRDAFGRANEFSPLAVYKKLARKSTAGIFLFLTVFMLLFSCDGRKEIPFELTEGGRIVVQAEINGTSGRFFWDTGTAISAVNCNLDNLEFSRIGVANWEFSGMGPEAKDFYYLSEIKIGGVQLKTKSEIAQAGVLKDWILEPECLDGLLGINVFAGYWCELSFSKKKIILHKEKPLRVGTYAPAAIERNQFRVLVDVDGKETPFYVDTGGNGVYFPPLVIAGKTNDEYKRILSLEKEKARYYYLVNTDKISIFDDVFENKTIVTNSPVSGGTRGLLGVNFLKNYDLLFDFTSLPLSASGLYYKRVDTERDEKKLFPLEKASVERILASGIYSFYRIPEGITLGIVEGSVLNAEYGVTERTIIARIDGKPAQEISNADMWNMDISRVKNFTVLEDGKERTVELKPGTP